MKQIILFIPCAVLLASLGACTSLQNGSMDSIQDAAKAATQPFVEGYLEYAGPQEKWAGPAAFIVHVVARDPGKAEVLVSPGEMAKPGPVVHEVAGRAPASAPGLSKPGLSTEDAREQLSALGSALLKDDAGAGGCLYPVRVRLIRQDGSILEKQGCRSEKGWPGTVSKMASNLIQGMAPGGK
jgi:hypothetical protein